MAGMRILTQSSILSPIWVMITVGNGNLIGHVRLPYLQKNSRYLFSGSLRGWVQSSGYNSDSEKLVKPTTRELISKVNLDEPRTSGLSSPRRALQRYLRVLQVMQ